VSQSSILEHKWAQNQLEEYRKFAKQQYHEELRTVKIPLQKSLPTILVQ
jgi:hypothetical protein